MKCTRAFVGAAIFLLAVNAAWSADWWHEPELVKADHVYTMDYVTPHVQWAKPLPGGPVRALFFVRAKGTGAREVAELCQRADIQPKIVYYDRSGEKVDDGKPGQDRALRLIREHPDVFVFGNCSFDGLTYKAQYYLLEQVLNDGAGLVCFDRVPGIAFTRQRQMGTPPPFLTRGIPLSALERGRGFAREQNLHQPTDSMIARRLMTQYRLGTGRALGVVYPGRAAGVTPDLDFSFEALGEYEYWAALAAKAVTWAAGYDPTIKLVRWAGEITEVPRDALPDSVDVHFRNLRHESAQVTILFSLCDQEGRRIKLNSETCRLAPGETGAVAAQIPRRPAGQYYLEARMKGSDGAQNFGIQSLQITSAETVENVELTEDFVEVGGQIHGSATFGFDALPGGCKAEVRLRDAESRIWAVQPLSVADGKADFAVEVPEFTTILTRAEVAVVDDHGDVCTSYATFRVPDRRRGQFHFVMWDFPRGVLGYRGLLSLRENGVTAILSGNDDPPAEIAAADLAYIPYTTRILEEYDENMVMKPACWNDDEKINEHVQEIADRHVGARKHGVYVYSLGDENDTHGACAHPECLKAYRAWLKSQYGTIEALNTSWASEYESFDDIELYKEGDINAQTALNDGHPARWYDRQAFKRYNYAHYCHRYAEAYAEMDPKAITGFEGAGGLGDDYHEIISQVGFWGPYPSIGDDIIRSLAPRSLITSNWMGYHREALPMVEKMWRMISNGYHGVWWWRWDNIGRFHGFLAPDFHPWDDTSQPVIDEMRDIRNGVGTFMLNAEMPHDGIALLYSMPSAYAGESPPRRRGQQANAHLGFLNATQDIGLQAHYVCDDTVIDGDLNDGDERVLLLPMCRAISDAVAEEIRQFVEEGGLVIADVRPGIRDGHIKPRSSGVLDDVFGISQDPAELGGLERGEIETSVDLDGTRVDLSLAADTDPDLKLAGANALADFDGTPLVAVHEYGQGHAVLLNFTLTDYEQLRENGAEMPIRELLRALYAKHGITPLFDQHQPGGPLRATETVRWESGDITLIGLFKTAGEDTAAITELPEPMHVYDLRRDAYLGEVKRIEGRLRRGHANLYALLPRRLGEMMVRLRQDTATPGDVVEGEVGFRSHLRGHVPLKLQVFRPDGSERKWPRTQILTDGRGGEFTLPIPHNAQKGSWTIQATDLFSNQTAVTGINVQ